MNDSRFEGSGDGFVRSLIDAAKNDAPPAGAKARALAALSGQAATQVAARSPGVAKVAAGAFAALAVAAAAVLVVQARGRASAEPVLATAEPSLSSPRAAAARLPSDPLNEARGALGQRTACEQVELLDREPTVCSTPGRHVSMEISNACGEAVDLFWVDFKCRETFVARLEPGASIPQQTFDTHPWRVRDHETHRLLKEWIGPAAPEPPEEPVALPDLVIEDGAALAETPPSVCSAPSNQASLRFVNERAQGVSIVFWVDYDCHEQVKKRLEPGETWATNTFEAHPWRVRDENGALLADFDPGGEDTTVHVSVP